MVLLLTLTYLSVQSILPIRLPGAKGSVYRVDEQDQAARVWFPSSSDPLPNIQNNIGLYVPKTPTSYSLVNTAPGAYTVAAPYATEGSPNTFSLSLAGRAGTITALDIFANHTYWTKKVTIDTNYGFIGPAIYSSLDGSIVIFVQIVDAFAKVLFYDGKTGTQVKISGADYDPSYDLGGWHFRPMMNHIVLIYTEVEDTAVRVVDGRSKKVVYATPFTYSAGGIFVGPNSVLFENRLVDLLANKTVIVPRFDYSIVGVSYADSNTLAIATKSGTVRSYDLSKGAYLPESWVAPGSLINMEQYGRMVLHSKDKVTNYITNQTWQLEKVDRCDLSACSGGYIVRNSQQVDAPCVAILNDCDCEGSFDTLVYQIPIK